MSVSHSYNDVGRIKLNHRADGASMGKYTERYVYDAVGNLEEMQHVGIGDQWTRLFTYTEPSQINPGHFSNRLSTAKVGNDPAEVFSNLVEDGYDPHGSLLRMPHLQAIQYNYRDQMSMSQRQAVNQQDIDGHEHHGERTFYVYDASGERIRKVTESGSGELKSERLYLGDFEIYRKHLGANAGLVRETVHIVDDEKRIAMVETRVHESGTGSSGKNNFV